MEVCTMRCILSLLMSTMSLTTPVAGLVESPIYM